MQPKGWPATAAKNFLARGGGEGDRPTFVAVRNRPRSVPQRRQRDQRSIFSLAIRPKMSGGASEIDILSPLETWLT
jgi:hypothetical protein